MLRSTSPVRACVSAFALVGVLTAFACKDAPQPTTLGTAPKTPATTPATATTIAASTSASTTIATPEPIPATPSPFSVAAVRTGQITVGTFGDGAVYASADSAFALVRDGGALVFDVKTATGIFSIGTPWRPIDLEFGGRFPDDAWAVDNWMGYARGTPGLTVFHWQKGRWSSVPNGEGAAAWFYEGFAPWKDGSDLALRLASLPPGASPDEPALAKLLAKLAPRFETPGKKVGGVPVFAKGVRPRSFAALPSGEVLAVVDDGVGEASRTKVQRWPAGDAQGVIESLPQTGFALDFVFVTMSSKASAWVGGDLEDKPYLAHFDGQAWTKVDAPSALHIASMAEAADGTLWLVMRATGAEKGELWKRPAGASAFARVSLPTVQFPDLGADRLVLSIVGSGTHWASVKADAKAAAASYALEPQQVVVAPDGEPFVAAEVAGPPFDEAGARWVLLRTSTPSAVLALPAPALIQPMLDDLDDVTMASASKAAQKCGTVLVTAGDVPEGAPESYDPIAVRTAVKGLPPSPCTVSAFEVKMQGKRRVAFHAPEANGCGKWLDGLVAAISTKVPGAKPKVYCRVPLATRALSIDIPRVPDAK